MWEGIQVKDVGLELEDLGLNPTPWTSSCDLEPVASGCHLLNWPHRAVGKIKVLRPAPGLCL